MVKVLLILFLTALGVRAGSLDFSLSGTNGNVIGTNVVVSRVIVSNQGTNDTVVVLADSNTNVLSNKLLIGRPGGYATCLVMNVAAGTTSTNLLATPITFTQGVSVVHFQPIHLTVYTP